MTGDQKFGPERRVRCRQEFLRIQSTGRKVRSSHFLLAVSPKRQLTPKAADENSAPVPDSLSNKEVCLGITVTKRIDKRAARRNRLKRRIREVFRRNRRYFFRPVDLVVIALDGAVDLELADIRSELRELFCRARLISPKQELC